MRLSEIKLSEAPLADISYHPTANPGGFSAHEVALIKKYKANGTYNDKLKGVPFNLYVYIVDDQDIADLGMYYPEGTVSPRIWKTRQSNAYSTKMLKSSEAAIDLGNETFQAVFATIRDRMEKDPKSVHFIVGDNYSDTDRISPTPWMIAHRLVHAAPTKLFDIPDSLYKLTTNRSKMYRALYASLPMASARLGKLNDPGEMLTEIATQILIKGDIKIDEDKMADMLMDHAPPKEIQKAISTWKTVLANAVKRLPVWASKFEGKVLYI
jgi:hypothetical protein